MQLLDEVPSPVHCLDSARRDAREPPDPEQRQKLGGCHLLTMRRDVQLDAGERLACQLGLHREPPRRPPAPLCGESHRRGDIEVEPIPVWIFSQGIG